MKSIRQDKFEVGDKVNFIPEDEYISHGIVDGHKAAHGPGPYDVEEVQELERSIRSAGHTQILIISGGERFSGWWFQPIRPAGTEAATQK